MMRSMFAGVSGLRNHQTRMDVIGNNIANVNTVGFKKSRVTFQDVLSQTVRGSSAPQGGRGGTNPQQIGLGMTVATIETVHAGTSLQSTGKNTDLAIQGDGFFVLDNGTGGKVYTRAGAFDFDPLGNFINSANGMRVVGIMADGNGVIDPLGVQGPIDLSGKQSILAKATTQVALGKNLDSGTNVGETVNIPYQVFDSLGNTHEVVMTFTKTATANEWDLSLTFDGAPPVAPGVTTVTFNADGTLNAPTSVNVSANLINGATTPLDFTVTLSNLTQYAGETSALATEIDGYKAGDLQTLSVDTTGTITGVYSNGQSQKLAQVVMATFTNPTGLEKMGENLYRESNSSGLANIGIAGNGGRGTIAPGNLEMSNVDLSQEFTDMIVTQRGFQANSRIITVSDAMLEELVNLKR